MLNQFIIIAATIIFFRQLYFIAVFAKLFDHPHSYILYISTIIDTQPLINVYKVFFQ